MPAKETMTPPKILTPLLLALVALPGLVAACGGGEDDSSFRPGALTDPGDVPTATPWEEAPEIIIIDPNAIIPVGPEATPVPTTPGGEPGECGPKYTVASGDNFSSIAEKCGVTTQGIVDANPGVDPRTLHIGDVINIPQSMTSQ